MSTSGEPLTGSQREVREAVERGLGETHAELLEVARVYLDPAARRRPTDSVMEVLGYGSRATASRKVRQAREQGIIPAAGAGDGELEAAYAAVRAHLAQRQQQAEQDDLRREAAAWARANPEAAMQGKATAWVERQRRRAQTTSDSTTGEDGR